MGASFFRGGERRVCPRTPPMLRRQQAFGRCRGKYNLRTEGRGRFSLNSIPAMHDRESPQKNAQKSFPNYPPNGPTFGWENNGVTLLLKRSAGGSHPPSIEPM